MLLLDPATIDDAALPRDRTHLDAAALAELQSSIAQNGLRMPIEVYATTPGQFALISGLRRLTAWRALNALRNTTTPIPAVLRTPATLTDALRAMVEENDIRHDPTPWERAHLITALRDAGTFDTLDAAIAALYPNATRHKRARLRNAAQVIEDLGDLLTHPELLSERQMLRLSAACRADFTPLIVATLEETRAKTPEAQWSALLPVLQEAETTQDDPTPYRPGRPRRLLQTPRGVVVRRERSPEGWLLRFSGPEASGLFMESVMDEVERLFG